MRETGARAPGRSGPLLRHPGPREPIFGKDRRLALGAQQSPALPVPAALLLGLALVVQLLSAGERQLDLGAALLVEIELERHQRHALALDRASELVDLAPVQQELARTLGRMIETAALKIFGDIGVDEPDFAAARIRIGFGYRRLALPQRLDLGAGQCDPGLERLTDLVVESSLAVVGDDLALALGLRCHSCNPFGDTRNAEHRRSPCLGRIADRRTPAKACPMLARKNRRSTPASAQPLAVGTTCSIC